MVLLNDPFVIKYNKISSIIECDTLFDGVCKIALIYID